MNPRIPQLLLTLIESGQWHHPGDDVLYRVIPLLSDPIDFRSWIPSTVASELQGSFTPRDFESFKMYRNNQPARPLPWLNADEAVFIAVNRIPGDDVAIALDFRDAKVEPKVVASHYRDNKSLEWFEVAATFAEFAQLLGLVPA